MVTIPARAASEGIVVASDFKPHPLMRNRHLQTIWPSASGKLAEVSYDRERVDLPDGDFIDLDWFAGNPQSENLALLLHGLGGTARSNYIKRVGGELVDRGFRVVAMNLRGASGPNRTTKVYHSGKTDDLDYIVDYLHNSRNPEVLVITGFSLGGNVLLKWLGENPGQQKVSAAAAVSVPYDLAAVADRLNQGFSSFYRDFLLKNLRRFLRSRQGELDPVIDLAAAYRATTFEEYDDIVTAPLSGFDDAADYYNQSSAKNFLKFIDTPTLLIHARDDPFTTVDIIPDSTQLSQTTTLEVSDRGGHVGFVERGAGLSAKYYLPERLGGYLAGFRLPGN